MSNHFPIVILVARPAAGKSEVIDFLKKTKPEERLKKLHVGAMAEFDDFLYIWEWFEEDDILQKHGRERLHTKPDYYFKNEFAWNLCIEKINLAVAKRMASESGFLDSHTAIIEFARGGANGFREAFDHLSDDILSKAAIVYIKVSYQESVRKNKRRARKGLEDSILYHSLPDDKMEYYYKVNDWDTLAKGDSGHIEVKGRKVPFAVLNNEPEVTDAPEKLGPALEKTLGRLWELAKH